MLKFVKQEVFVMLYSHSNAIMETAIQILYYN